MEVAGLSIACIPERKSVRELLILRRDARRTDTLPFLEKGQTLGTSSERRKAQVEAFWPGLMLKDLRGNVPTRLAKLKAGQYDAILLAEAGLLRLQSSGAIQAALLAELDIIPLDLDFFVPAPAQGALALQCRSNDKNTLAVLSRLHRAEEAGSVASERKILKELAGGCHLPLGAHFSQEKDRARAWIFLGRNAPDNRTKKSFTIERQARSCEQLAGRLVREIKNPLPVILTGRRDRLAELQVERAIILPLLSIEEIAAQTTPFIKWQNQPERYIAVFSVPAVRALANWLSKNGLDLPTANFLCTGTQTQAAVSELFPAHAVRFLASDGTGESLAADINNSSASGAMLIAGAETKQGDFHKNISRRFSLHELVLYRTVQRSLTDQEKNSLPDEALVVLASPSAVQAFFYSWPENGAPDGFIYCAIGPTTARAIEQAGEIAYMIARGRDYQSLLQEPFFAP
jgi:hydroxymethylbilane synthase